MFRLYLLSLYGIGIFEQIVATYVQICALNVPVVSQSDGLMGMGGVGAWGRAKQHFQIVRGREGSLR